MPRAILLLINRDKPDVGEALPRVRRAVAGAGGTILAELDADDSPINLAALPRRPDFVMSMGGDGTLLSQARRFAPLNIPLLGLNLGKLGFLAEFDLESLESQAAQLLGDKPLVLQDRAMIAVRIRRAGSDPHHDRDDRSAPPMLALNDAVVTAGPPFRMISLMIAIDGQPGPLVTGDGLIITTPVGSTAYNASAGGPIIAPDVRALAITPIAAHTLSFRPVVVSGTSEIELTLTRVNQTTRAVGSGPIAASDAAAQAGTSLVLDGREAVCLHAGDRVILRLHDQPTRFVHNPKSSYWETLIRKMHWAAPPRLRTEGPSGPAR